MKRRVLALLLGLLLCLGLAPRGCAVAPSRDLSRQEVKAAALKSLGLFQGVSDTNFALERVPSRAEALVMLIRLLGQEGEALSRSWQHPFTDVPAWADKYVGYAYATGLTTGTSATTFGTANADAAQYLTFVLRALGYSDRKGDFKWNDPYALAAEKNLLVGVDLDSFLRADVVSVSYAALNARLKGLEYTLSQKLMGAGVFTEAQYQSALYQVERLGSDPLYLENEAALRAFLLGTWEDAAGGYYAFTLSADGTFTGSRAAPFGGDSYAGTWKLERYHAGAAELPDRLSFTFTAGEDDWRFGDYLLFARAICDGDYLLLAGQVPGADAQTDEEDPQGDSQPHFGDYATTLRLRKVVDGQAPDLAQASEPYDAFTAICWDTTDHDGILWLERAVYRTDGSRGVTYATAAGRSVAVPYLLSGEVDNLPGYPVSFYRGKLLQVTTGANGTVTEIDWADPAAECKAVFDPRDDVISGIWLGEDAFTLADKFGQPRSVEAGRDGPVPEVYYRYPGMIATFTDLYGYGENELCCMNIVGASVPLENGLGIGSSADEVRSRYPDDGQRRPLRTDTPDGGFYLYGERPGSDGVLEGLYYYGYQDAPLSDGSYTITYTCEFPWGDETNAEETLTFYIDGRGVVEQITWSIFRYDPSAPMS